MKGTSYARILFWAMYTCGARTPYRKTSVELSLRQSTFFVVERLYSRFRGQEKERDEDYSELNEFGEGYDGCCLCLVMDDDLQS